MCLSVQTGIFSPVAHLRVRLSLIWTISDQLLPDVTRYDQFHKVKREHTEYTVRWWTVTLTKCDQFYYEGAKRPFGCKQSKPSRQDLAPQSNSAVQLSVITWKCKIAKWDCFGWNTDVLFYSDHFYSDILAKQWQNQEVPNDISYSKYAWL